MYKTLLLCVGIFCALHLSAQRNISGVVKSNDNQERLPFANIVVKGSTEGTTSNVDGYFSLINTSEEEIILQVDYVGFGTKEVVVPEGSEDVKNLEIKLSSGITMDEVVIQGKSYKVMNASEGISSIQVSPAQLKLLPNVGEVDIFRSLQLLPQFSGQQTWRDA